MSMLNWALVFLVISINAAIFGFGGIEAASADSIVFFIFILIFFVLLVLGLMAARRV